MSRAVSYDYDNHGRVASAETDDSAWGLGFEYDSFSNRTKQAVTKGQGYSHEVRHDPETNWMLSDDTSYDANGNIVLLPMMRMSYDVQNRMVRMQSGDGTERYGYNHTPRLPEFCATTPNDPEHSPLSFRQLCAHAID